jgi:hypothetical protein
MAEIENTKIIYRKALRLAELNKEFKLIRVNNTFQLESKYFGNSVSRKSAKMTPVELAFIKKVKKHILDTEVYTKFTEKYYRPTDIRYISASKRKAGTTVEDVIEIDIDEAYWKTAYILGAINEEIYNLGSKDNAEISKTTRLIALGSLAKKIDEYEYVGSRLVKHNQIRSELTENIWYSICKTVSDAMWAAKKAAQKDFCLFWVDGIYVKNNASTVKKITQIFESYGYNVKTKDRLQIEYNEMTAVVKNLVNQNARPFYLPKKESKKRYFTDTELKQACFKYMKHDAIKNDE